MNARGCITGLIGFIVLLFVFSMFIPRHMNFEYKQTLEASPEQIFNQVNNVKNWQNWSPWFSLDPNMEVTYSDNIYGQGAEYTWNSEKKFVGTGKMIIDESIINEMVGTTLKFEGQDDSYADMYFAHSGAGTDVTWDFKSDYKSSIMPWKRFYNGFSRMMLKSSYKKGLRNMDQFLKDNPDAATAAQDEAPEPVLPIEGMKIEEVNMTSFNAITHEHHGKWSEFGSHMYAAGYTEVNRKMTEANVKASGMPFARWIEWNPDIDKYVIQFGIPVESGGEVIEGGPAVKGYYYGDYQEMSRGYITMEQYCKNKGYSTGMPIEVFASDPGVVTDTAKWLTELYFPIEEGE